MVVVIVFRQEQDNESLVLPALSNDNVALAGTGHAHDAFIPNIFFITDTIIVRVILLRPRHCQIVAKGRHMQDGSSSK